MIYGRRGSGATDGDDLGCTLRSASGQRVPKPLGGLSVILGRTPSVTVSGHTLEPLFTVPGYVATDYLSCTDAAAAEPLAVAPQNSLAVAGPLVGVFAAAAALLFLAVGLAGLSTGLVLRRSTRPR